MKRSEILGGIGAILGVGAFIFQLLQGREADKELEAQAASLQEGLDRAISESFDRNTKKCLEDLESV